jgi:hypothetical protein
MRLTLTNVLNRAITGKMTITLGNLLITYPQTVRFKANETKDVLVKVTGGAATADNTYPLAMRFDAGKDGVSLHHELMHVNVLVKRTITRLLLCRYHIKLEVLRIWQASVPASKVIHFSISGSIVGEVPCGLRLGGRWL